MIYAIFRKILIILGYDYLMNDIIFAGLLGGAGGLIRGVVGLLKSQKSFDLRYCSASVLAAGLIGIVCGAVFNFNPAISLLAGYVGIDGLESLWKIYKK